MLLAYACEQTSKSHWDWPPGRVRVTATILSAMTEEQFDVVVVGAGRTLKLNDASYCRSSVCAANHSWLRRMEWFDRSKNILATRTKHQSYHSRWWRLHRGSLVEGKDISEFLCASWVWHVWIFISSHEKGECNPRSLYLGRDRPPLSQRLCKGKRSHPPYASQHSCGRSGKVVNWRMAVYASDMALPLFVRSWCSHLDLPLILCSLGGREKTSISLSFTLLRLVPLWTLWIESTAQQSLEPRNHHTTLCTCFLPPARK